MQDYQLRVLVERDDLAEKHAKLKAFLCDNSKIPLLDPAEHSDLCAQVSLMCDYLNILERRIARFGEVN